MAPEPFPGLEGCAGVTWHRGLLPGPSIFKAFIALCGWPFLVLWIAIKCRVDRFAIFGFPYAAICGLASTLTGKPIVTFVRSDWIAELELAGRSIPTRFVARMILYMGSRVSRVIVANSASLGCSIVQRLGRRRAFKILPNDIETYAPMDRQMARAKLAKRCGYSEDRFVLGYVGTFKPRKQVWQVVDVLHCLRDTTTVLVLVGDGADRGVVMARVRELGLGDRVYWLGWQKEVREFVAGMDLTILPSRFEGNPNAVLESIEVGTPAVGADVMGISDILPEKMRFPLDDVQRAVDMVREGARRGRFYCHMVRLTQEIREKYAFDWDAQVVETIVSA
jgi:glycosyltransferase involved in cell wall biosynthesis